MEVTISRESLAEINGKLPTLTNYLTNTFTDMGAAALWLKENKCGPEAYETFNLENIMKNIEKAIKGGNHYYGMGWRRVNG